MQPAGRFYKFHMSLYHHIVQKYLKTRVKRRVCIKFQEKLTKIFILLRCLNQLATVNVTGLRSKECVGLVCGSWRGFKTAFFWFALIRGNSGNLTLGGCFVHPYWWTRSAVKKTFSLRASAHIAPQRGPATRKWPQMFVKVP